eukprot:2464095-Amphidinium_carterae.1
MPRTRLTTQSHKVHLRRPQRNGTRYYVQTGGGRRRCAAALATWGRMGGGPAVHRSAAREPKCCQMTDAQGQ